MRMSDVVDGSLEVVVEGYKGLESYFGGPHQYMWLCALHGR